MDNKTTENNELKEEISSICTICGCVAEYKDFAFCKNCGINILINELESFRDLFSSDSRVIMGGKSEVLLSLNSTTTHLLASGLSVMQLPVSGLSVVQIPDNTELTVRIRT